MGTVSADTSRPGQSQVDRPKGPPSSWKRVRYFSAAIVLLLAAALLPILHNNYRFTRQSRADFKRELDRRCELAIDRLDSQAIYLSYYESNSALLYMICDMAELSGDDRLHYILRKYLESHPDEFWNRVVFSRHPIDFSTELKSFSAQKVALLPKDFRWFYYAVGGDAKFVPQPEMDRLFSPTANRARTLTHQLFVLCLLRERLPDKPDLQPLIDTLCERIAREATYDFRVTDMYIQRVAFLLGAGRDDLVKPRWIEKIMDKQREDGGWHWHWSVNPFASEESSSNHTSVQAAWALCMIKYRFPEWIDRNYPE